MSDYRLLVVVLGLVATHALADEVDDIHARLNELGVGGGADYRAEVEALYRDLHEGADRGGVEIVRDIRYGIHGRQRLDLYLPEDRGEDLLPVVVFVHGGNLASGDRSAEGMEEYLYGNVATFFAKNGFIGVNANYRLAPDVVWPQGAEDMREILGWLWTENAESYGGDPGAMFMVSSTGGARHVSSYLYNRVSQMVSGTNLLGAALISPVLGLVDSDSFQSYYGEAQPQTLPAVLAEQFDPERPRVPTLFLTVANDPSMMEISAADLFSRLCEKYGSCPRIQQVGSHNRYSAIASFNTADDSVSSVVLDFFRDRYDARQTE